MASRASKLDEEADPSQVCRAPRAAPRERRRLKRSLLCDVAERAVSQRLPRPTALVHAGDGVPVPNAASIVHEQRFA